MRKQILVSVVFFLSFSVCLAMDFKPQTLHLCPACLRELESSIGFDVVDPYERLRDFYQKVGFEGEANWTDKRLGRIVN